MSVLSELSDRKIQRQPMISLKDHGFVIWKEVATSFHENAPALVEKIFLSQYPNGTNQIWTLDLTSAIVFETQAAAELILLALPPQNM